MTRGTISIAILAAALYAAPATAQNTAAEERLCLDDTADAGARARACGRLIDEAAYTDLKDYAKAHMNRALALTADGDHEAALSELDTALDYDPYSYPSYIARGGVLLRLGEPYRAIADFSVAAGLNPLEAEPYAKRGLALFAHKEFASALQDLETALTYDPGHADARRTAAWILAAAPDAALRDGEKALGLLTDGAIEIVDGGDLLVLAAAQAEAGRPDEALETYRRLAEEDPRAVPRFEGYLAAAGYFDGPETGTFDAALTDAIHACLVAGCRIGAPRR